MSQEEKPDLLTIAEVADILRVDVTTVRRWIRAQVLPAVHLPHRGKRDLYRIRRATLDQLLTPGRKEDAV